MTYVIKNVYLSNQSKPEPMAKAKYGNTIIDMVGSVSGNTHQHGRYGQIVRKKGKAINRNSTAQAVVRDFFSTLTKNWRSLTDNQRVSFRTGTADFQKKDSLSQTIILTGHQLYIALNRNLQTIGQALITSMPFKRSIPAVTTASVDADVSDATIVLTYTPAIPATDKWVLRATAPLSAGKFSNSQNYKVIDVLATADASPADVTAAYEVVYGTSWKTAGAKIFFTLTPVGMAEGIQGTTSNFNTVVVA